MLRVTRLRGGISLRPLPSWDAELRSWSCAEAQEERDGIIPARRNTGNAAPKLRP